MAKRMVDITRGALVVYIGTLERNKPGVEECALLYVSEVRKDDELLCFPISLGGQVLRNIPITLFRNEVSLAVAHIGLLGIQLRRAA